MAEIVFREKQRFRMGYGAIALAMPPAALLILCLRQLVWHHPWGNPPMSDGGIIFLTVLVWLVFLRLMTVRLVTELRPDRLSIRMKGLVWRKRIPLARIQSADPVGYDAMADYRGYGIRSGPLGRAYIASGDRGVRLRLNDESEYLIGSQRADELARRISEVRNGRSSP